MTGEREAVDRRTDAAFAESSWADPRPAYRELLRRLREQDGAAFENAVREYETRVVARLADAEVDPVAAWLDYGRQLAELSGHGRTVAIDADGRAGEPVPDAQPAQATLLLHLPADESAAAIVVAAPRQPSSAQHATVALLADRAQTLPT